MSLLKHLICCNKGTRKEDDESFEPRFSDVDDSISYSDNSFLSNRSKFLQTTIDTQTNYIIDNELVLPEENFHCILDGICGVCLQVVSDLKKHYAMKIHKKFVRIKNVKVLADFSGFVTKLPLSGYYHCGVCNASFHYLEEVRTHCDTDDHKKQLASCRLRPKGSYVSDDSITEDTEISLEVANVTENVPLFDINIPKGGLFLTKDKIVINTDNITINYDEFAEFAATLEAPLDFISNRILELERDKKTFLKAIKIDRNEPDDETANFDSSSTKSSVDGFSAGTFIGAHINHNNVEQREVNVFEPSVSNKQVPQLKKLNVNVKILNNQVQINNKISISIKSWHCVIGSINPNCCLCDQTIYNMDDHIKNQRHVKLLMNRKENILFKYGLNIIMELGSSGEFHCGVCNIRGFTSVNIETHVKSDHHLRNYDQCKVRCEKAIAKQKIEKRQMSITSLYYVNGRGVLLNKNILLSSNSWHACVVDSEDKTKLYCYVCDAVIKRSVSVQHWNDKKHLTMLRSMPLLEHFMYNCIRRITKDVLFCTICRLELRSKNEARNHIRLDSHKEELEICMDDAKDVINKKLPLKKLQF